MKGKSSYNWSETIAGLSTFSFGVIAIGLLLHGHSAPPGKTCLELLAGGYVVGFSATWLIHLCITGVRKNPKAIATSLRKFATGQWDLLYLFSLLIIIVYGVVVIFGPIIWEPPKPALWGIFFGSVLASEFSIPLVEGTL